MNVLSLFDGISCGKIAFELANIKIDKYYSSEIDKHCNTVSAAMFPDIERVGDITTLDISKLDKIDMLIGGSPCQSFSFAGKRNGMSTKCELKITTLEQYLELKESNFEFEGQSYLFWEYMRILRDIQKYNPDVIFFLENVVMSKEWEHVLSEAIRIKPIMINSSLVSAQNRKRLYWSNIKTRHDGFFGDLVQDIEQPEDKGILLKDVLEDEDDEKYYLSDDKIAGFTGLDIKKKSRTLRVGGGASADDKHNYDLIKIDVNGNPKANQNKASCLTAGGNSGGNHSDMDLLVIPGDIDFDNNFRSRENGKARTLKARARESESCDQLALVDYRIRRLTPRKCFRLQTVPEYHIDTILDSGVSNSQLYKMCGNGWTVEVITHFFRWLNDAESQQLNIFQGLNYQGILDSSKRRKL